MTAPFVTHAIDQQAAQISEMFSECRIDLSDDGVDFAIRLVLSHVAQTLECDEPIIATGILLDAYRQVLGPML